MADVHVIVVDEGLYVGNGQVHRWLLNLGNRLYQNVVHAAPERSGELRAGIDLDFTQGGNLRILEAVVSSSAPHTGYVIHGTAGNGAGYIYTTEGYANQGLISRMIGGEFIEDEDLSGLFMVISDGGPKFHLRVHGQQANNFLVNGYNATARTHRALHPFAPEVL